MGVPLSSDFSLCVKRLIDDRTYVRTIEELKAVNYDIIPPGLIVFCEETGESYKRTLVDPDGTGDDFDQLWIPVGSGGKIEKTIISNVPCGAIDVNTEVKQNTALTMFASMLLFEDRNPDISGEFNVSDMNDIMISANRITNPTLTLTIDDMGGATNIKRITYKGRGGTTLAVREVNPDVGVTEDMLKLVTGNVVIDPSEGTYDFIVVLEYDKTRTLDVTTEYVFSIKEIWPYFRGVCDNIPSTSDDIKALTKIVSDELENHKYQDSITCNNQYDVLALPSSLGKIVKIKDQNGFDITDTYETFVLTMSSDDSRISQPYNVYYSKDRQILTNYTKMFYTFDPDLYL